MRFLFCFLFTIGCSHKKEPMPRDTLFLDKNRDWYHLYEQELKTAIYNKDDAAFYFFWPEYLKEIEKRKLNSVIQK